MIALLIILWFVCGLLSWILGVYTWYKLYDQITLGDVIFESIIGIMGPIGLTASIVFFCADCCDFKNIILLKKKK
jgi:hypothetical protein